MIIHGDQIFFSDLKVFHTFGNRIFSDCFMLSFRFPCRSSVLHVQPLWFPTVLKKTRKPRPSLMNSSTPSSTTTTAAVMFQTCSFEFNFKLNVSCQQSTFSSVCISATTTKQKKAGLSDHSSIFLSFISTLY